MPRFNGTPVEEAPRKPRFAGTPVEPDAPKADGPRDGFMGKLDSAVRGAADTLSLGFADEIAAGLGTGFGTLGNYDEELARQRGTDKADAEDRGGYRLSGQLAGGLAGGAGLARNGLSMGANAVSRGANLARVAVASSGEGAILGGAHGFGSGEGLEGRAKSAAIGGGVGLGLGLATPLAVAGVQRVGSMAVAPVMARLMPEGYAQRAVGEALRRSGMSADDIADALTRSQADDQGMFTVADAMGNSGQRMLSTVARNPSDARQGVIEALQNRQVGQGDRLSSFLAEGFDAPDTAAQRTASLTARRGADADVNFTSARNGANPVNLNSAIGEIDSLLGRDPILGDTALSAGPLGPRLNALRGQLQKGGEQLIDFDKALNIKSDLYQQMQRNPQVANDLRGVYRLLDEALENSSQGYRQANDTFRTQSRVIDAVEMGRNAQSGRMRSADTIPQFNALTPDQQAAFRPGYVDPHIARIESTAMSPTTNKARALITAKTGEEFPAFAVPGRAEQMGNRIAREQRMFETSNAALGGSKTADNLADAAEMSKFDPGVMAALMRLDLPGAVVSGARTVMNEAGGTPPRVIERIADTLMHTDPAAARAALAGGANRLSQANQLRARVISALVNSGAAGAGRLAP